MRKPRDLDQYEDAEVVAQAFEWMAAQIRRDAVRHPSVKWSVELRNWNPKWADRPKVSKSLAQGDRRGAAAGKSK